MSHWKGHSKKSKTTVATVSTSVAGVTKSTVSRSDLISRVNDTPLKEKGISYSTL